MRDNGHHWPLCPTAKTLIRLMRRPLLAALKQLTERSCEQGISVVDEEPLAS
jgi:hypothetical protein